MNTFGQFGEGKKQEESFYYCEIKFELLSRGGREAVDNIEAVELCSWKLGIRNK